VEEITTLMVFSLFIQNYFLTFIFFLQGIHYCGLTKFIILNDDNYTTRQLIKLLWSALKTNQTICYYIEFMIFLYFFY